MAVSCYRKPGETGPHVFYVRLEDNTTFQVAGEDAKFNFLEATAIEAGADPKALIAKRPKVYHAPAEKVHKEPAAEPEIVKPRGPGRPPRS